MVSGSSVVEFGRRNLALHSALSHRTVVPGPADTPDEPDPLIDLVSPRRLARADRYRAPDPRPVRGERPVAPSASWPDRRDTPGVPGPGRHGRADVRGPGPGGCARRRGGPGRRGCAASAVSAALRVLAEHGLAERGPGGWRRGPVALADVAESTGAADLHREREARYKRDRESWRARLRQYQGARARPVNERDGWWSLDDPDEYDFMACRGR